MLDAICKELNNWFCDDEHKYFGSYTISNGVISLDDFLQANQYFRIVGSVFNDGVYKYGFDGSVSKFSDNGDVSISLIDETFDGSIWAMSVPGDVMKLASEIEAWESNYSDVINSPYSSESFGGYSYSKKAGVNGSFSWQDQFKSRLNKWRKI